MRKICLGFLAPEPPQVAPPRTVYEPLTTGHPSTIVRRQTGWLGAKSSHSMKFSVTSSCVGSVTTGVFLARTGSNCLINFGVKLLKPMFPRTCSMLLLAAISLHCFETCAACDKVHVIFAVLREFGYGTAGPTVVARLDRSE